MAEFKDRLRQLRLDHGLTQTEFAEKISADNPYVVTRSAVSQWEYGNRMPHRETLETICRFFDVSQDYMLGRSESTHETSEVLTWDKDAILKWAQTADLDDVKAVLRALMDRL